MCDSEAPIHMTSIVIAVKRLSELAAQVQTALSEVSHGIQVRVPTRPGTYHSALT